MPAANAKPPQKKRTSERPARPGRQRPGAASKEGRQRQVQGQGQRQAEHMEETTVGRPRQRPSCARPTPSGTATTTRTTSPGTLHRSPATSFAILQKNNENGKVKIHWGEGWRRSSHNATVRAWDVPTHHTVGDFVAMTRRMAADGGEIHLFGHDLLNTYRPRPVKQPYYGLCFGATASAWNFTRVADALQLLTRMLLLMVGGHYVDDFNGLEFAEPPTRPSTPSPTYSTSSSDCGLRSRRHNLQDDNTSCREWTST